METGFSRSSYLGILAFATPLFALNVKGWSSAFGFLFLLSCLIFFFRKPESRIATEENFHWKFPVLLAMPFLCELIVAVGRLIFINDIPHAPSFDTASRFLIGAILFAYLFSRRTCSLFPALGLGCFFSLLGLVLTLILYPGDFWGGTRAATRIVDPNTLGCYAVAIGSLAYFSPLERYLKLPGWFLRAVLLCCILWVAFASQSRSAFLSFTTFILFTLFLRKKRGESKLGLTLVFPGLMLLVLFFEGGYWRLNEITRDLDQLLARPDIETSIGARVQLLMMDWELFKLNPIFGIKDGALPPYEILAQKSQFFSEVVYRIKLNSGSHTEYTAWIVKQGIFGFLSLYAIFFAPLIFFLKNIKSGIDNVPGQAIAGAAFLLVLMFGGLGVQLLNLKLGATLFSVVVGILFCEAMKTRSHKSNYRESENKVRIKYFR